MGLPSRREPVGLGTTPGGPVAANAPIGSSSFPRLPIKDLLAIVRFFVPYRWEGLYLTVSRFLT